eukprot:368170-Pleurochrysis_carterae.AAC.1
MPAAFVASDLLADPVLPFIICLCSGEERAGDLAEHLRDTGLQSIHVDYVRGGIGHDLAREDVASR